MGKNKDQEIAIRKTHFTFYISPKFENDWKVFNELIKGDNEFEDRIKKNFDRTNFAISKLIKDYNSIRTSELKKQDQPKAQEPEQNEQNNTENK